MPVPANASLSAWPGGGCTVCHPGFLLALPYFSCEVATVCPAGTYKSISATSAAPNVCENFTACLSNISYEIIPPSGDTDRVCKPVTRCSISGEYINKTATLTRDAHCAPCRLCQQNEDEVAVCNGVVNRECRVKDRCSVGAENSNPCPHNATCSNQNGYDFTCSNCTSPFTGSKCDQSLECIPRWPICAVLYFARHALTLPSARVIAAFVTSIPRAISLVAIAPMVLKSLSQPLYFPTVLAPFL